MYGIRLAVVQRSMSWREFHALAEGLMCTADSRVARFFAPVEKEEGGDDG